MRELLILVIALTSALPVASGASEADLVAADRIATLALKLCLTGGSETTVTIAPRGDSIDVTGATAALTVRKSEAQGLVGGLSPNMTRVLAQQASEARACAQAQFSSLSQKLWVAAGGSASTRPDPPPMTRYINGDRNETIILGHVAANQTINVCIQDRPWEDGGDQKLLMRVIRTSLIQGSVTDIDVPLISAQGSCVVDGKPGRRLQAFSIATGQYAISTLAVPDNGLIGLFDHYLARPQKRVANLLFDFAYSNVFTVEIRINW